MRPTMMAFQRLLRSHTSAPTLTCKRVLSLFYSSKIHQPKYRLPLRGHYSANYPYRLFSSQTEEEDLYQYQNSQSQSHTAKNDDKILFPTTDTFTTTTTTSFHYDKQEPIRTSLLMELTNGVGVLHDVLRFFWKYDINITRIESRPCSQLDRFDFFVDLEGQVGDTNVDNLLSDLKNFQGLDKLLVLDKKEGKMLIETYEDIRMVNAYAFTAKNIF
jgi:hypothetical protein